MLQKLGKSLDNLKFKPLTTEQLVISADRLTRFKYTETKYLRVFKEIITGNLIEPKYKKSELDKMEYDKLAVLAEYIINESLKSLGLNLDDDYVINQKLYEYENEIFNLDENINKLLKNKINYKALISIFPENLPVNLKWLKTLYELKFSDAASHKAGFLFPVKKLVICEGITEETLLPEFAKLLNYDFNKNGVFVISAGGKNQVVKTFYKFVNCLKIPIFVLLDNDAAENCDEILPRLRSCDKIYRLKTGEFEDILSLKLIEKTLKYATENISLSYDEHIDKSEGMVHYLEEYFKNRGAHEFKKSEFANLVKINISGIDDVSEEFKNIISELAATNITVDNL